ncbi:Aldo/keto reductase [Sistotremastrum niveocremeum HHB9708]|uniref:Aldo/keto reductase n=1 Tax=Sistotremastrum niveocremeum HHB9708 TaxID=1314777 RepID=A0A165AFQ4_9AGAM|nr:Aldo/keto reductase [Sistotremastrum niveocremeum HHB9708]
MSDPSSAKETSALKVVMGAMTFGAEGYEMSRVHKLEDVKAILDAFQGHGHDEVDTARIYGGGTSEEYLAKSDWQKRKIKIATKLYPLPASHPISLGVEMSHKPEDLRKYLQISLKALNAKKIDLWTVNDLYKEGYFYRFGVSNYPSWEVAEMVSICRANGWIQPTVYQGIYNAVHRVIEPELLPCLRKFGISFYVYSPLGGGFFTGSIPKDDTEVEAGSRFDPNRVQGQNYRARYWNESYFKAIEIIQKVSQKYELTMAEVALRWLSHHSALKREFGDAVIIGASSLKHTEANLVDLEKAPLPEEVVQRLDDAWDLVKAVAKPYAH